MQALRRSISSAVTRGVSSARAPRDDACLSAALASSSRFPRAYGGEAAPAKPVKLAHSPEDLGLWGKLGFSAPSTTADCPALYEQMLAKREWLKTAPPKAKKAPASKSSDANGGAATPTPAPQLIVVKPISDSKIAIKLNFS